MFNPLNILLEQIKGYFNQVIMLPSEGSIFSKGNPKAFLFFLTSLCYRICDH